MSGMFHHIAGFQSWSKGKSGFKNSNQPGIGKQFPRGAVCCRHTAQMPQKRVREEDDEDLKILTKVGQKRGREEESSPVVKVKNVE